MSGMRTRQRLPAGRPARSVVDHGRRSRGVHRLRHQRRGQHPYPPPVALPRPQRRPRLRLRHRAVVVGPRQRQRQRPAARSGHAAGHRQPLRRHGRPADHAPIAGLVSSRPPSADTSAPTSTITSPADGASVTDGALGHRHGTASDTGGGSWPGSRSRPTAAPRGTRRRARPAGRTPGRRARRPVVQRSSHARSTTAATWRSPSAGSPVNASVSRARCGGRTSPRVRRLRGHQRRRDRDEVHQPTCTGR